VRGTGPVLLVLQGGDGDADGMVGLVAHLTSDFTVVTYDRRGIGRSKLNPGAASPTVETHAEDTHHLLERMTNEPAFVFGASIGALIGLEFISHHPNQVRVLVAHEPPATQFLPEVERERGAQSQLEVEETHRREGVGPAMRKFAALAGLDFNDREADALLPVPNPQRALNLELFLTHDARSVRLHRLSADLLHAASEHVVAAVGATSGTHLAGKCATGLAHWLGREPVAFPGGHCGFLTHLRAFAARLREALTGRT
jgi:pimeloyl-ACP methyl ester carboxylesterase